MLRVEMQDSENDSTIRVDGRLTHEHPNQVRTVVALCKTLMTLVVDFTEMNFVNPVGEMVLFWLKRVRPKFVAENSYPLDACERLHLPADCISRALRPFLILFICAGSLVAPVASRGAELKEQTLQAWDTYVRATSPQMGLRLQGPFLWVDEVPDRQHRVHGGEILVSSVGRQNPKPVPSGLIHDWMGAAFIPDARLKDVLSAVRDYGGYKEFYKPTVVDSKLLGSEGACDKYLMRVVNKEAVAETALDMKYETCYFQTDERRWYSITHTTQVQEIRHYGKANEQELQPSQGSGYIWRLYSIARFEERDGGTYVEVEAIALSRDVPVALRWLVNPIVRSVSRNSMLVSLRQMEDAVRSTELKRDSIDLSRYIGETVNVGVLKKPGSHGGYAVTNGVAGSRPSYMR